MALELEKDIQEAVTALKEGKLIAYPTESVFGLGCDPQNTKAVEDLIKLKQRKPEKGLILIASNFEQLNPYIDSIDTVNAQHAKSFWPGAVTWLWPIKSNFSFTTLLTGKHKTIAVRVSNHPVVVALCNAFGGAIVSTSANMEGLPPAKTAQQVNEYLPNGLTYIIDSSVGDLLKPTPIYDVMTRAEIR